MLPTSVLFIVFTLCSWVDESETNWGKESTGCAKSAEERTVWKK